MSVDDKAVYLVIRYDDFGAAYSTSCAARFEVEQMLQREMAARGWPWVCAVTPRQSVSPLDVHERRTVSLCDDELRVSLLRRAASEGLCEPAAHGLTHHTWKQLPVYGTEFAGLAADKQYDILRTAKDEVEELAGKRVSVLVPPWNSYDEATVRAAAKAGFQILSAGIPSCCLDRSALGFVPCTIDVRGLKQLFAEGKRLPEGSVVVMLFHAFDFVSVDGRNGHLQVNEFGPLLDRVVDRLGMEVVPLPHIPDIVGGDLETRVERCDALRKRYIRLSALPVFGESALRWLLSRGSTRALVPVKNAASLNRALTAAICFWFMSVTAVACLPAFVLGRSISSGAARSIALLALAVAGSALAAYCTRNALLKRLHARWGTRQIGLRTLTGLVAGSALVLSAVSQWIVRFVGGSA